MSKNAKLLNEAQNRFKELSTQALEYKRLVETAKTNLKKEYYQKKLNKTNKKVYEVLAALNILSPSKEEKVKDEGEDNV